MLVSTVMWLARAAVEKSSLISADGKRTRRRDRSRIGFARHVGNGTSMPVRSGEADEVEHDFGSMAPFAALDMITSSAKTRTLG